MGQNTGWGAVIWTSPATGDGFVMLTDHSRGYEAYRWALCDWVRWVAQPSFGYLCKDRDKHALGPLGAGLYAREWKERRGPHLAWIDSLARATATDSTPGLAILVMRDGAVVHAAGYGVADLATGRSITEDTPFYLASMSKQLTAFAILRAAKQGLLTLDDSSFPVHPRAGRPGGPSDDPPAAHPQLGHSRLLRLPARLGSARPHRQCVGHRHPRGKPLDFAPGSKAQYSNSGYVLLARVLERVTGRNFGRAMTDLVYRPAGMHATMALDDSTLISAGPGGGLRHGGEPIPDG